MTPSVMARMNSLPRSLKLTLFTRSPICANPARSAGKGSACESPRAACPTEFCAFRAIWDASSAAASFRGLFRSARAASLHSLTRYFWYSFRACLPVMWAISWASTPASWASLSNRASSPSVTKT